MSLWRVRGYNVWDTDYKVDGKAVRVPLYVDEEPVKPVSWFFDTKGRQFNSCVHAKQISMKDIPKMPSYVSKDGELLFLPAHSGAATQWTNSDSLVNHNTFWIAGPKFTVTFNVSMGFIYSAGGTGLNVRSSIVHNNGRLGYNQAGATRCETLYTPSRGAETYYQSRCSDIEKSFWKAEISRLWESGPKSRRSIPSSVITGVLQRYFELADTYNLRGSLLVSANAVGEPTIVPGLSEESLNSGFMFGEQRILDMDRPYLSASIGNYWLSYLKQHAFLDACESMPRLSDNSISNIQEIFEFLLSIVRREPPKLPKSLGDAWLAYRYQFSTTKMDIKEAISFVCRYADLDVATEPITTYGLSQAEINGVSVLCKAEVVVKPRLLYKLKECFSDFKKAWFNASMLGLAPDLYQVWDSTPFSFIVDWFLPVGDVLALEDASLLYTGEHYDFQSISYSLSYARNIDDVECRYYSRWLDNSVPRLSGFYWIEPPTASSKSVAFRALDAVSLFHGMFLR